MKRYLVFGSDSFYPSGGWNDFIADFDGLDEAKARADAFPRKRGNDWAHVIDTENGDEVHYVQVGPRI